MYHHNNLIYSYNCYHIYFYYLNYNKINKDFHFHNSNKDICTLNILNYIHHHNMFLYNHNLMQSIFYCLSIVHINLQIQNNFYIYNYISSNLINCQNILLYINNFHFYCLHYSIHYKHYNYYIFYKGINIFHTFLL